MASITLPVSESDVKQMEAAGLLADLPHKATPGTSGETTLDFTGGDLDLYRFSQRYLRKIRQGFWYDPDRTPGNGDEFYILGRQLEECTVETRGPQPDLDPDLDAELAFLQEERRGPLAAYTDSQVSSLQRLGIFQRLKGVARGDLCRVLNSRIASHPSAQAGFIWDRDGDPNSGDHFFVSAKQHEALLPVLDAVKPAPTVMESPYGKMRTVEGDRETGDLYEYRLLLTNRATGKTDLFPPTPLPREQVTFDQLEIPLGYEAPSPADFKKFAESHPEYFEQGHPSPSALVESSFRISIALNGKPVPIVAKSSISGCPTGIMKIQGLHVIPVALSDEEAVELASLTRPGSSSTGIICVSENPVDDSGARALGKRIYEIRLDRRKLAIAIETLKTKTDSGADPIELLPGYFVSNTEAKAHLTALEEIRDGTFDFNVWAHRHPGTVYAVDKVFSLLLISALVVGGYVLISTDWVSRRIATGNLKRTQFEREIAATIPRDWLKEVGSVDFTEEAKAGKFKYLAADPEVHEKMIARFTADQNTGYFQVRPTGSGKSTDFMTLAKAIAEGTAGPLNGRRVVAVRLSSVVAFGQGIQGGFEAAMMGILQQAEKDGIIIFFDEAVLIKDIGTHSGRKRGAEVEMLNPVAEGRVAAGFATTPPELKEHFPLGEEDPLIRRCDGLDERPPPSGAYLDTILSLRSSYHKDVNGVEVTPEAVAIARERANEVYRSAQPSRSIALIDRAVGDILAKRRLQAKGQLKPGEVVPKKVTPEQIVQIIAQKREDRKNRDLAVLMDQTEAAMFKAAEWGFDLEGGRAVLERSFVEGESVWEYSRRLSRLRERVEALNLLISRHDVKRIDLANALIETRELVAAGGFVAQLDRDDGESAGSKRGKPERPAGPVVDAEARPASRQRGVPQLTPADLKSLLPRFDEPFADPAAAEAAILAGASEGELRLWRSLFPGELKPGSAGEVIARMQAVYDLANLSPIITRALLMIENREASGPAVASALFRASTSGIRDGENLASDGERGRRVAERYVALLEDKASRGGDLTRRESRRLRALREERARRERGEGPSRGAK